MTLRTRLVLALAALLAVGMVVYGVGTYQAFAAAEVSRLDDELRDTLPLVQRQLVEDAGRTPDGTRLGAGPVGAADRPDPPGRDGGPPRRVAPGTYAVLLAPDGSTVATLQVTGADAIPDLADLPDAGRGPVTRPSVEGDGSWRVIVVRAPGGGRVLVAVPLTSVAEALRGLLVIEVVAGAVLLGVLAAGAWLVLRAGLRPLERMAVTAGTITAGNLDRRVPTDDRSGSEVAQLGTAINGMLDDLQAAFAERAAAEARLRRFVADASHELRTPLTSIQGYAELFRLGQQDRGTQDPSAPIDPDVIGRRIEEESARMRRLVEDLLTLARLDDARVRDLVPGAPAPGDPAPGDLAPGDLAPVDLAVIAADACTDATARDVRRPLELDAPLPVTVHADEGHLRQAVTNLVANAMQHTPRGTPIEVAVHRRGDDAVLVVRDHGPGLDADALDHVFDRFWQADRARSGSGTGLGLSIVAAIAAEHGGAATAATHPDGGAVFTLTLPAGPPDRQDPTDAR